MVCSDCRGTWDYAPGERAWFEAEGISLPRRCKPCRDVRRALRAKEPRFDGVVTLIADDESHGWINSNEDGTEFYFRMTDVSREQGQLRPGDTVTFRKGDRNPAYATCPRASLVKRTPGETL